MTQPKYKIGDKVFWMEERVKADEVRAVILVSPSEKSISPYFEYVVGEITRIKEDNFEFTLKGGFPVMRRENRLFPTKQDLINSL